MKGDDVISAQMSGSLAGARTLADVLLGPQWEWLTQAWS